MKKKSQKVLAYYVLWTASHSKKIKNNIMKTVKEIPNDITEENLKAAGWKDRIEDEIMMEILIGRYYLVYYKNLKEFAIKLSGYEHESFSYLYFNSMQEINNFIKAFKKCQ